MFDTRIEILEYTEERDDYNELVRSLVRIAVCFAQRTESGGRENLYAERIVHENEVVYTIRYREGLRTGQMIRDEERLRKIISIHEEGRRWRLHLKCTKSDAEDSSEQNITVLQNCGCRC